MKKLYAKKETICSVVQKILSGVTHLLQKKCRSSKKLRIGIL